MIRSRSALAVFGLVLAMPVAAQRGDRLRSLRSDEPVVAAFTAVVAKANSATVEVLADGDRVAFGTVVRAMGFVVTKASEIGDGELTCRVAEESYAATVVGTDERNDLALLALPAEGLTVAPWSAMEPRRGAWFATPDGDGPPAAIGILSSAPYRHTIKGYLGVSMHEDPTPPRLSRVEDQSAAAVAGFEVDDVILAVGDDSMRSSQQFIRTIGRHLPGEEIRVRVKRGEAEIELVAKLRTNRAGARSSQERIWGPLSEVRGGFGSVLQHDSVLRPDQCGGPVVGLDGDVVGVNIARAGRVETLAIPAATVIESVRVMLDRHKRKDG